MGKREDMEALGQVDELQAAVRSPRPACQSSYNRQQEEVADDEGHDLLCAYLDHGIWLGPEPAPGDTTVDPQALHSGSSKCHQSSRGCLDTHQRYNDERLQNGHGVIGYKNQDRSDSTPGRVSHEHSQADSLTISPCSRLRLEEPEEDAHKLPHHKVLRETARFDHSNDDAGEHRQPEAEQHAACEEHENQGARELASASATSALAVALAEAGSETDPSAFVPRQPSARDSSTGRASQPDSAAHRHFDPSVSGPASVGLLGCGADTVAWATTRPLQRQWRRAKAKTYVDQLLGCPASVQPPAPSFEQQLSIAATAVADEAQRVVKKRRRQREAAESALRGGRPSI